MQELVKLKDLGLTNPSLFQAAAFTFSSSSSFPVIAESFHLLLTLHLANNRGSRDAF